MQVARPGALLVATLLLVAACGRIAPAAHSADSPSPAESPSPAVAPSPLAIAALSLTRGEVAVLYPPVTVQATGGIPPYTWRVAAGSLPGGMTISADGVISGTPATRGSFSFTLAVTDAGLSTASVAGSITIAPKLVFAYINHAYNVHTGYPILDVCVEPRADHPCPDPDDRTLRVATVSGGAAPYTYEVASGVVPPMSRLNGLGLAWQPASYNPGALPRGDYQITIRVTDSLGGSVVVGAEYWLYAT